MCATSTRVKEGYFVSSIQNYSRSNPAPPLPPSPPLLARAAKATKHYVVGAPDKHVHRVQVRFNPRWVDAEATQPTHSTLKPRGRPTTSRPPLRRIAGCARLTRKLVRLPPLIFYLRSRQRPTPVLSVLHRVDGNARTRSTKISLFRRALAFLAKQQSGRTQCNCLVGPNTYQVA